MEQLGFDLFAEEAGNETPPPPARPKAQAPDGWYVVDGWIKRNPKLREELVGIPTIMRIPDDGMAYTDAQFRVRNEWTIYFKGFGITTFRKEGTTTLETAYGLALIGALKVIE
jgi:hypothetical protein